MSPMESIQEDVDKFIIKVKKGELGSAIAQWPDEKVKQLCIKLIKEESKEMLDAIEANDWAEIIDGAADTIFVVLYAMSKAGIRLDKYWEEVCWTNLQKEGGPVDKETGKQLKPEGWKPPRIEAMLNLEKLRHESLLELKATRVHHLKTWSSSYEAVSKGKKTHEWRKNDYRNFMVGDFAILQEFGNPDGQCAACDGGGTVIKWAEESSYPERCLLCAGTGEGRYSGKEMICEITHVTGEGQMSRYYPVKLSPETNWVVMSIKPRVELQLDQNPRILV